MGILSLTTSPRRKITTQRAFNGLSINKRTVTKSSQDELKIEAEFLWFRNLPESLKPFIPNVYGYKKEGSRAYYSTDYLYSLNLSDISVFTVQSRKAWDQILYEVFGFIKKAQNIETSCTSAYINAANSLYLEKTISRLQEFNQLTKFDVNQNLSFGGVDVGSLMDVAKKTAHLINPTEEKDISIIHGDICFSNILYDYRSRCIKLIDPRGTDVNKVITNVGDIRYDLAKLTHSIVGYYDL